MSFKSIYIILILLQTANLILSADQNDTLNDEPTNSDNTTQNADIGSELTNKLRLVPLTDSLNDFGMQLIRRLNNETEKTSNVAFSPLSIGQIFSMILSSAQNETLDELMKAFAFNDQLQTPENVNNVFKLLLDDYEKTKLDESKRQIKLSLPSLALYSTEFNIKKSFRTNLKDNYKSVARKIDFSNNDALNIINSFVKEKTNGLIPKLLEKLDSETKLALVNAFYFKGDWVNQFEKNFVKDRAFFNADKTTSTIKLMFRRDYYNYFDDTLLQAISIPYLGNASMTILLPQKNKSISDLIQNLNNSLIDYYRYQMKLHQVELYLPKLKVESSIDLKVPITELGVVKAFGPEADFGGITSFKNVYISEAVHKAYLEINEQGTEAAAASGLGITTKSFSPNMKKMIIDRPFVFLIHDQLNNLVLFMGAIKKL